MPEGDSVYRTARRLDKLAGETVRRSDFRVPQHANADLAGLRLLSTRTHGKHLFTRFDEGVTLHSHLRMDGSWTVLGTGKSLPRRMVPQVRVLIETDSGRQGIGLMLPVVELIRTGDEHTVTDHLGPDLLAAEFDAAEAVRRLGAQPRRPIVAALLDQKNLAGLGNLWVNEVCFLRGVSPWAVAGEIDLDAMVALAARMLRFSAFTKGAAQVTTGDARPGHDHWIYGRKDQACRRCGTRVRVAAEVPGDPDRRRTYWCPQCQPGPGPDRPGRAGPGSSG